jgi:hypothetical protein
MLQHQKLIRKNFNYRRETIPLYSDEDLLQLTMPLALYVGGKDIMLHSEITTKRLKDLLPQTIINLMPEGGIL